MTKVIDAIVVSQRVEAPADAVYAFASRMEGLPKWASGLAAGIRRQDGEWLADSPMGTVKVRMAPPNPFGVLDHDVTLPDGTTVHNAFRVTPCGEGSLLSFVVLRLEGTSEASFQADVEHVRRDLAALDQQLQRRG